ncbi:MAG TPA: hypothetical protein VHY84_05250 [Bryobacteraceae bacterium]|jgi:hypothetical protein|nr:hypothetical protein [Bryobacteraceae bacterium]
MMSLIHSLTTMDWVVLLAVVLAAAFSVAWMCSPGLRGRIEQPKYRFLADIEDYDRKPK